MRRRDEIERTPPPLPLPAARLYIHDAPSLATRAMHVRSDDHHLSKHSSLRSVSPTHTSNSTRDLTMRSWHSHSTSSDDYTSPAVHDHSSVHHHAVDSPHRRQSPPPRTVTTTTTTTATPPPVSKLKAQVAKVLYRPSANDESPHGDELQQIKESVERLRAQRTHVEQLRERNERLELLLADRAKENEKLRLQFASMQGVEQENVGLLKSFQLLEERIHALEATCHARKEDARAANERLAASDKTRASLQLRVDELASERDYYRQQLGTIQSSHEKRVLELQSVHAHALDKHRRDQSEWQRKAQASEHAQGDVERKFQDELAQRQRETQQLVQENRAMEQHVQHLLATTVRQTTMIEDCDRLLRESKSRHETAKASYRDQLQLNATLQTHIKELESKLSTRELGLGHEKTLLESKLVELETKARKLKDKNAVYVVALQDKENHCEKFQRELLVRDRARFHVEDVVKELRQKEKTLLSEISTLKVALTDLVDEKSILQDQLGGLHEQLEKERKDRSRWATARLKLLAEFCDEENKLSSALHPFPVMEVLTDDGLEDVLGDGGFGDGGEDEERGVDAAVAAAGMKMDALDRRLHSHPSGSARIHQRPTPTSKPIVFG